MAAPTNMTLNLLRSRYSDIEWQAEKKNINDDLKKLYCIYLIAIRGKDKNKQMFHQTHKSN